MSSFGNPRFAEELAYRTMVNYYNLRDFRPLPAAQQSPELEEVLSDMKKHGFETTQRYEVTLALNSLIGLLILPQQEYYKESMSDIGFYALPALKECMLDSEYINTYHKDKADCPAEILRHMRNAVAHNSIMIYPESANGMDITHIVFRDKGRQKNNCYLAEFQICIPVKKLEAVLMEIARYLIGFAKNCTNSAHRP